MLTEDGKLVNCAVAGPLRGDFIARDEGESMSIGAVCAARKLLLSAVVVLLLLCFCYCAGG